MDRSFDFIETYAFEMEVEETCSGRSRVLGKEEGVRVLGGILGQLVQYRFEMGFYVEPMFFQRV